MRSLYTVIRKEDGGLVAIPYSEEYREFLEPASKLLRDAAEVTDNPSLSKFLRSRADAFLKDDYFQSDLDWMDLDSEIEPRSAHTRFMPTASLGTRRPSNSSLIFETGKPADSSSCSRDICRRWKRISEYQMSTRT